MNIVYGSISLSAALSILKMMGLMEISWLMASLPLLIMLAFTLVSSIVWHAAFQGASAALSVLAMKELTPEEIEEITKGKSDENSVDI